MKFLMNKNSFFYDKYELWRQLSPMISEKGLNQDTKNLMVSLHDTLTGVVRQLKIRETRNET